MPDRFCFRDTRSSTYVPLGDIVRFEADGGYTNVHLNSNEVKVICSSLCEQYEKVKDSGLFFRIHKAHLVNTRYIFRIFFNGTLVLLNGTILPVSRRELKELLEAMER
jgi:two-component system LytT family response regulator